mmetsp:Transcript_2439/g.5129  ORF Transcript_2439/g.5129 Transcript_2439/m.5129 type:complete len:101 (-) Transcript_2439:8022-8324(-)
MNQSDLALLTRIRTSYYSRHTEMIHSFKRCVLHVPSSKMSPEMSPAAAARPPPPARASIICFAMQQTAREAPSAVLQFFACSCIRPPLRPLRVRALASVD